MGEATKAARARRRRRAARLFKFDRSLGARFVAGADEAGRGSLAGPLVVAAVLIDYERLTLRDRRALGELDDSKQRSPEEREELYPCVLRAAERVAVAVRCVRGIDRRGLHITNLDSLGRCLDRVAVEGAICLVDGFRLGARCSREHMAVVDGDARSAAIAAASVIAKVTRDRYMHRIAGRYPEFGFAENVGYSTPEHRAAIVAAGPSDIHRRSFQSIAYSQLELSGGPCAPGSEGAFEVLPVEDVAPPVEGDADDVEAQPGVVRELAPVVGEPGTRERA
jgi:ribonuclease HII